jgi:hypothetical protein
MPAYRAGTDTLQNPIRFKNQLSRAEERLSEMGLRAAEITSLLQPLRELVDNYDFWQRQSDGLAVFRSADCVRYFRLPIDVPELVVVTDRFHIKPLLGFLTADGHFFVLALSQNAVRLLECTRYKADEVKLPATMPTSLSDSLKFDDIEKQLQLHSVGQGGEGGRTAVFHGHGTGSEEEKARLTPYFRQIDHGLREILRDERAPLVLAGVEYFFPIYKSVNSYAHLISRGIPGNPDTLKPQALHEKALRIVEPTFQEHLSGVSAQYQQARLSGRASRDVKPVVLAAYQGRIESLIVGVGVQRWGRFDEQTGAVEERAKAIPGDVDLLDLAAIQTILRGGAVYAVEPGEVPENAPLAAVFRF